MIATADMHKSHRTHRNVLYTLVVLLSIIQIASFIFLSVQVSKLNLKLDSELSRNAASSKKYTDDIIQKYDSLYQQSFSEVSELLANQKENFQQEIALLKTSKEDFTGVIQEVVKSVVTVSTDKSVGTGFVVGKEGYIVTNYHVIAGREDKIRVLDYERDSFAAQLVGKDENRDLALLKVNQNFKPLELADSDQLAVGQKVIAIGNPLGLSFSVTEGIISALNRPGPNGLNEYVQTDVSLNPGNSGGPLIDGRGRVVGINNFKIGDAEALGFALESNHIKDFVNEISNQTLAQ